MIDKDKVIQLAREVGFEVHPYKQQARVGMDALIGADSTPKLLAFAQAAHQLGLAEREAEVQTLRKDAALAEVELSAKEATIGHLSRLLDAERASAAAIEQWKAEGEGYFADPKQTGILFQMAVWWADRPWRVKNG